MDVKQITETTKNFYKNISTEFSSTRQYAWKGWTQTFENIDIRVNCNVDTVVASQPKVLDLGCGNARFYEFLKNKYAITLNYTGLDTDEGLLKIAREKYINEPNVTFENIDIIQNIHVITDKYDLVVGFGITHHLPGKNNRLEWFDTVSKLVNVDGYLVLSFWNFLAKKSLVVATELEENDYWLSWNNKDIKRYCHYYDENELEKITNILKNNGFVLKNKIQSEEDLNIYMVFKKELI